MKMTPGSYTHVEIEFMEERDGGEPFLQKLGFQNSLAAAGKALLELLTDEQRTEIFANYCSGCGAPEPPTCHCQNDE